MPVAHGEGCYFAEEVTLDALERDGRVLFRYLDNPNGSLRDIAGVRSTTGNVAGLMPHPERAAEPLLGTDDGLRLLRSLVGSAGASLAAAWVR